MTCCPYLSSRIINWVIYESHLKADQRPVLEQEWCWYLELSLQCFFQNAQVFLLAFCLLGVEATFFVLSAPLSPFLFLPHLSFVLGCQSVDANAMLLSE